MNQSVMIIGVAGGSGSGKTTFARELATKLGAEKSRVLGQDSYYKDQSKEFDRDGGSVNYDHPHSIDFSMMAKHLDELGRSHSIQVPCYSFSEHRRLSEVQHIEPAPFIIVDGILLFSQAEMRVRFNQLIFIETPEELRFSRRLSRDVRERGRTPEGVHDQFFNQVKPMHDQFVEPSRAFATQIISGAASFKLPIDRLVESLLWKSERPQSREMSGLEALDSY